MKGSDSANSWGLQLDGLGLKDVDMSEFGVTRLKMLRRVMGHHAAMQPMVPNKIIIDCQQEELFRHDQCSEWSDPVARVSLVPCITVAMQSHAIYFLCYFRLWKGMVRYNYTPISSTCFVFVVWDVRQWFSTKVVLAVLARQQKYCSHRAKCAINIPPFAWKIKERSKTWAMRAQQTW